MPEGPPIQMDVEGIMPGSLQPNQEDFTKREKTTELPSRDYDILLRKLESIFIQSPEEQTKQIQEFVKDRLEILENQVQPRQITGFKEMYKGFIHPESNVRRNIIVDPFHVDDNDLYLMLIGAIREHKENEGWKNHSLREIVPHSIQLTLSKYFGNQIGSENINFKNQKFYLDRSSVDSEPISINEFRGKNLAVCAEKAAVAQNLLSFIGIDSYLVYSSKCRLTEEPNEDAHAYNIGLTQNGCFIFDPSNPREVIDQQSNRLKYVQPALYRMSDQDFEKIKSGGTVTVTHENYLRSGNEWEAVSTQRTYGGPVLG